MRGGEPQTPAQVMGHGKTGWDLVADQAAKLIRRGRTTQAAFRRHILESGLSSRWDAYCAAVAAGAVTDEVRHVGPLCTSCGVLPDEERERKILAASDAMGRRGYSQGSGGRAETARDRYDEARGGQEDWRNRD